MQKAVSSRSAERGGCSSDVCTFGDPELRRGSSCCSDIEVFASTSRGCCSWRWQVHDRVVHAQAAEGDAGRAAMVHPGAAAAVARDAVLGSDVAKRQLAAAAPAAGQAGEQRLAMLGRAVMPAGRKIACHHRADRFEPFPAHIAVMGAGLQGEPFVPRLARVLTLMPSTA